jgi:hypothetical protein
MDEPTAGAENGVENNDMQSVVAKIIAILPKQSVLLSATLPNLITEFPTLATRRSDIIMVETQRLPVGCVAIAPDGNQLLPHEISSNFDEFVSVVKSLQTDALMQRFYTPGPVYKLAKIIEKYAGDKLPIGHRFESVITNIGDISHKAIRIYAVELLSWVTSQDYAYGEEIYQHLVKNPTMNIRDPKAIESSSFVVDHVASEGRALAVTTTFTVTNEEQNIETLDDLIKNAMAPYIDQIPDVHVHLRDYLHRKEEYNRQYEAFLKAKKPEEADMLTAPEFSWPIQIAGFSAVLSDEEMGILDGTMVANMLSGLGKYDPAKMTPYERDVVMREAGHGRLACLFSSPDIVYGTNMALITVFIGAGYGHIATRNSLYQLIGRAGRTGKSHKAKILFQDLATMRKALLPEPQGRNFEAEVMDWHLREAISKL